MNKKIAVLSTGANGSCIAADLTRAGLDVSMIDQWAAHIEAMRANGLTITTKDDEYNVAVKAYHLSDICTLNEKFDVVLLTSKAYDSRWLTEFIKPYLADDGLIVAVQNCMTAEMIGEIVGLERTVGCVVELASQLFEPGEVRRSTVQERTWFGLGAFDPAHADRLEDVAEVLRHAGTVDFTDDVLSAKWMKLIVNAMTMALKAILGTTNEQVFKLNGPEYAQSARELFLRAGEEALAAGQLLDYKVVPIFGLTPKQVENTNSLLETLLEKIVHDVGPTAINTVLQDHMKGRYSEIDMINGMISDESRNRGKTTPVTDVLVELTREIHAGELKPDLSNLELVRQRLGH
jgi:2-dehydropantoate 2-reductase